MGEAEGPPTGPPSPDPEPAEPIPPPSPPATGGSGTGGGSEDEKKGDGFPFPTGLAAAIAVVVAGLAAVGVSGDTLTRAIRNEPTTITWAIIVALGAAAALVALNLIETRWNAWWKPPSPQPAEGRGPRWVGILVAVVLAVLGVGLVATVVIASAVAMLTGANQVTDREQPLVSLAAATDEQGLTTITIDVRATGLQTTDQLLVQVIGLTEFTDVVNDAKVRLCERNWASTEHPPAIHIDENLVATDVDDYVAKVDDTDNDPGAADLLGWSRIGPDQSGAVESTIKVQFPTGTYQGVCAWAPLPIDPGDSPKKARSSAAYLSLNDVVTTSTTASGTTTTTASGTGTP